MRDCCIDNVEMGVCLDFNNNKTNIENCLFRNCRELGISIANSTHIVISHCRMEQCIAGVTCGMGKISAVI